MTSPNTHRLGPDAIHTYWDNALLPRLTISPGDTVIFETRDAGQGRAARDAMDHLVTTLDPDLAAIVEASAKIPPATGPGTEQGGHALSGPVLIDGAEPGDTLLVEILEVRPAAWGWTACGPGGGGLLSDELEDWTLHIWDIRSGTDAVFASGIRVPMRPFCGVMGVAPDEPGRHPTSPPFLGGGNMDVRQLTEGTTLALPVLVPGALFSVGDAHAAQGDGEVAGTAIEMDATVTLRFDLDKGRVISSPQLRTPSLESLEGPWFAATGHHTDLYEASREALRGVLGYLEVEHGLSKPQGIILASACVDLRISQIVNASTYTVTAFLPLSVFEGGSGL